MWNRFIYNTIANIEILSNPIEAKTLHLKAKPNSIVFIDGERIMLDCFGEIWLSDITVNSLKTEQDEMFEVSYFTI